MKTSSFQWFLATFAIVGAVHAQGPQHPERVEHAGHVEEHHVAELPRGRVDVRVGNDHYFEHRGTFYRPGAHGGYVVVRAPRGGFIPHLPPRAARIYIGGGLFYRYDDIYYQDAPGGYVVVDAPNSVPVASDVIVAAPSGDNVAPPIGSYQPIVVGYTQYFVRDGQFFQRTNDGMVWAAAPIGAVTTSLPADATSVWYQDIEYFDSDGVFFRKTPDGFKVVNAPWIKN